jgi:hypothetical protein
MPITLNGTTGIQNVLGSASSPAESNTTSSNTGLYFPTSTTLGLSTAGTAALTIDASQNVGIGTTSPSQKLQVANGNIYISTTNYMMWDGSGNYGLQSDASSRLSFYAGSGTERMRFTSSGAIWKNYTSEIFSASAYQIGISYAGTSQQGLVFKNTDNSAAGAAIRFVDYLGNFSGGGIYYSSSNSISYTTTSDYRLKNNIQPMTYGLNKISALKPVTYSWNVDNTYGEGFIAHELKEIIPSAVIGEKDGFDANDNPAYQSVDYSKIVVHLVAAVQELSVKVDTQAEEIANLKSKIGA